MTKKAEGLRDKLARAATLATRLGEAADELNSRITDVESAMQSLKLGVVASVPLYEYDNDGEEDGSYDLLTFGKEGSKWRLLHQYGSEMHDVHKSVPLVNATREVRIAAAGRLPALLDRLLHAAEEEIARVQEKGQSLADLASEIRAVATTKPEAP